MPAAGRTGRDRCRDRKGYFEWRRGVRSGADFARALLQARKAAG